MFVECFVDVLVSNWCLYLECLFNDFWGKFY